MYSQQPDEKQKEFDKFRVILKRTSQEYKGDIPEYLANYKGDSFGHSLLFYACSNGHLAAITKLLKMGANPNEMDKDGMTPLHCLIRGNIKDGVTRTLAVSLMLQFGADPEYKDEGKTFWENASEFAKAVKDNTNFLTEDAINQIRTCYNFQKENGLITTLYKSEDKSYEALREKARAKANEAKVDEAPDAAPAQTPKSPGLGGK